MTGRELHADYVQLARAMGVPEASIGAVDWDTLTPEQRAAWDDHALSIIIQDGPERSDADND